MSCLNQCSDKQLLSTKNLVINYFSCYYNQRFVPTHVKTVRKSYKSCCPTYVITTFHDMFSRVLEQTLYFCFEWKESIFFTMTFNDQKDSVINICSNFSVHWFEGGSIRFSQLFDSEICSRLFTRNCFHLYYSEFTSINVESQFIIFTSKYFSILIFCCNYCCVYYVVYLLHL